MPGFGETLESSVLSLNVKPPGPGAFEGYLFGSIGDSEGPSQSEVLGSEGAQSQPQEVGC